MLKSRNGYIFDSAPAGDHKVTNNIKIKTITNITLFKEFFKVPWTVYQKDDYWVPPFWKEIKAFFLSSKSFWSHTSTKLFIAYKNNKPVGRIAAIIDRKYNKYKNKKIGLVNIDAHLDVREIINGRITSGTPFRRLLENGIIKGENFVEPEELMC